MTNLKLTYYLRYILWGYLCFASAPLTQAKIHQKTKKRVTQKKEKHHYVVYACITLFSCIILLHSVKSNQNSSETINPVETQPHITSTQVNTNATAITSLPSQEINPVETQPHITSTQANTNATATTSLPSQDDHIKKKYTGTLTDEFINYLEKSNEWQNIEAILKEVGIQSVSPQSEEVIDNSVKEIQEESDLHSLIDRLNPDLSRLPDFTDAIQPASRAPDIQRKYKLSKYLISQIRSELLERSSTLDLSSMKPIQDICTDFEAIKSQDVLNVCKELKKIIINDLGLLKDKKKKNFYKPFIKKWTDLAILRTIFETNKITQKLYTTVNAKEKLSTFHEKKTYWFLHEEAKKRRSDLMEKVRHQLFTQPILPKINDLVSTANTIPNTINKLTIDNSAINELQNKINAFVNSDPGLFKEYILKLAEVCFEIAFQKDPKLKIAIPKDIQGKTLSTLQSEDPSNSKYYKVAYLSEDGQSANYCLFPAITRTDTNHLISELHICFNDTLPDVGLNELTGDQKTH